MVGDVAACWWDVGGVLAGRRWVVGRRACEGQRGAMAALGEAEFRFGPSIYDCSNCTLN